ncbi:hypothetical protein SAMN05216275_11167 [Streptosporangium canum]|uniref:Uncharacterized protein n=1 Tax=Streptosporangium canum TaxID=324952 RepID=A0A1I3TFU8_9ACTN|nr:hypothetical protein [Streptosporangium canum]SFJ68541.1 hypothetical protein SAMN05216275_11167 [Streptosporangium canum]
MIVRQCGNPQVKMSRRLRPYTFKTVVTGITAVVLLALGIRSAVT